MVVQDWLAGAVRPALAGWLAAAIDPEARAKLLMALLGLVILGIGLMLMAMVGGRMVRRMTRDSKPPSGQTADRWYEPKRPRQGEFTYEEDDDEDEEAKEDDSDGDYDTDEDMEGPADDGNR